MIDNEPMLLGIIDRSYSKHSYTLTRYFDLFGIAFNKKMDISDIEDWTDKYKWPHKLYCDDNDKLIYG